MKARTIIFLYDHLSGKKFRFNRACADKARIHRGKEDFGFTGTHKTAKFPMAWAMKYERWQSA